MVQSRGCFKYYSCKCEGVIKHLTPIPSPIGEGGGYLFQMYKLDRNSFKASTVEEAADHATYYKKLSWQERLRVTMYLNKIAYKLVGEQELKMDKTVFKARAQN